LCAALHDAVVFARGIQHLAPFPDIVGRGLLHVDILASLRGPNGSERVPVMRRGECDGINVITGEQLACATWTSAVSPRNLQKQKDAAHRSKATSDSRVLTRDDIDAITFATPHHWHALGAIWGRAGWQGCLRGEARVPQCLEGRQMLNAARKYDRIMQCGAQCRSSVGLQEAIAYLREGQLGKIVRRPRPLLQTSR